MPASRKKSPTAAVTPCRTGRGDLWVKRPNLFNWHMTQPDESVLVSDGKTLWFYNPFVEQATATSAERRHQQHAVYADCPQPVQRLAAI